MPNIPAHYIAERVRPAVPYRPDVIEGVRCVCGATCEGTRREIRDWATEHGIRSTV